ncbi:MAG: GNAT family protein [Planctomycetota bacterium]|mgnify:CR=1 FL=1
MIQESIQVVRPVMGESTEYERQQRRKALFRVLADNIIRELLEAGYYGHELLGFAGEVMQAITDNGWANDATATAEATAPPSRNGEALDYDLCPRSGWPTIRGEKTLLRPPMNDDREALLRWSDDRLVRNSLIPPVLEHVVNHIGEEGSEQSRVDLVVTDRGSGAPVGLVSLHDIDATVKQAALGKMIGEPEFRGKGVAHEATRLILAYGFDVLNLHRIYLRTLGGSLKNIKLNERLGFRFEGVLQEAAFSEGKLSDIVLMAMLQSEFRLP